MFVTVSSTSRSAAPPNHAPTFWTGSSETSADKDRSTASVDVGAVPTPLIVRGWKTRSLFSGLVTTTAHGHGRGGRVAIMVIVKAPSAFARPFPLLAGTQSTEPLRAELPQRLACTGRFGGNATPRTSSGAPRSTAVGTVVINGYSRRGRVVGTGVGWAAAVPPAPSRIAAPAATAARSSADRPRPRRAE